MECDALRDAVAQALRLSEDGLGHAIRAIAAEHLVEYRVTGVQSYPPDRRYPLIVHAVCGHRECFVHTAGLKPQYPGELEGSMPEAFRIGARGEDVPGDSLHLLIACEVRADQIGRAHV